MPSHLHEGLVELFRQRPALAAELLTEQLRAPLPSFEDARLDSCDLTDLTPTEYRADAVVVLTRAERPVLAVVVEIQLRRDAAKRWSWPVYLATLRARLRTPVTLLVLCPDKRTGTWCAQPIELGHPGWTLRPQVVDPGQVPAVTDPVAAERSPELAVLSAMAHSESPDRGKVLSALLAGLQTVDDERVTRYYDLVLAVLPEAARAHLEELMTTGTYEYQSDFARKYFGQGLAEGEVVGEAKALLEVLSARDITVPDDIRSRILDCTDTEILRTWVRRAVTVGSADELFD
ncbi:hypothetical protein HFP15_27780 [Amycolatopsis sp. K13G38]|uniref:Rpn family recombination-promoting nuclease/putative transposase n=1 Tax=Amycolatopsis acididurans TaxID=2724524 RepID=A0ABX1JCU4_9PSEU|nr:hypothetical protein [Amycolatopsis acididurans]NKQ56679.1 hypothetical protein [Amycolatopsis acididurans]